jgi:hypothetical protein
MVAETKNISLTYPPVLVRQMSMSFYDTSTSAATGAARCGSFVGEGFGLLVVSYR